MDEAQLQAEVAAIDRKHVRDNSRDTYVRGIAKFMWWLGENKPDALTLGYKAERPVPRAEALVHARQWLEEERDCPFVFDELAVDVLKLYFASLRKRDGEKPGKSVYNTARSSLKFLWTIYRVVQTTEEAAQLKVFFKGVARDVQDRKAAGEMSMREGKLPFTYELLRALCMEALKAGDVFFVAYLLLSWNLMCRANNVTTICYSQLSCAGDSIAIMFAHQKNDQGLIQPHPRKHSYIDLIISQEGKHNQKPRHCYSNPFQMEANLFLALGLLWLVHGFNKQRVFDGASPYDRWTKELKKYLAAPSIQGLLERMGTDASHYGAHSGRKGGASFVASGSTSGPSSVALCLRVGWSMQGVQGRYLFEEAAGDQHVGRTVCGLDPNSPDFAAVPAHFHAKASVITEALQMCFPNAPPSLAGVLELTLASVVFHAASLRELAPSHPVFNTPLIVSRLAETLLPLVSCGADSGRMQATGIPPHVAILKQLQGHQQAILALLPKMEAIAPSVVDGVVKELEERAIGAKTVTFDGLQAALEQKLTDVLNRTGLTDLVQRLAPGAPAAAAPLQQQRREGPSRVHMWGGSFHQLPDTFKLPSGGVRVAWLHYLCANDDLGYPPLRGVAPRDVIDVPRGADGIKNQRKRFSDFRSLCGHVEALVKAETDLWVEHPTVIEANSMYDAIQEQVVPATTGKKRARRTGEMEWTTAVNVVRSTKKKARVDDSDDDDD
jgi:hypothetical protein